MDDFDPPLNERERARASSLRPPGSPLRHPGTAQRSDRRALRHDRLGLSGSQARAFRADHRDLATRLKSSPSTASAAAHRGWIGVVALVEHHRTRTARPRVRQATQPLPAPRQAYSRAPARASARRGEAQIGADRMDRGEHRDRILTRGGIPGMRQGARAHRSPAESPRLRSLAAGRQPRSASVAAHVRAFAQPEGNDAPGMAARVGGDQPVTPRTNTK